MEKLINIAEILKEKPKGTKLWSDTFGELTLNRIKDIDGESYPISLTAEDDYSVYLTKNGLFFEDIDGVSLCVFPSRNMRDWEKFAWKKGDVLVSDRGEHCLFCGWSTEDYEKFEGRYLSSNNYSEKSSINNFTYKWEKETKDFVIDKYIKEVERVNNAKLNLKTLELKVVKKPEFKDGDIVSVIDTYGNIITCIVKNIDEDKDRLNYYASNYHINDWLSICGKVICPASDSEKQQLFDSIKREGKRWNPKEKRIEDLPKKYEFKPMDWCLMRGNDDIRLYWELCQYAYAEHCTELISKKPYVRYHSVGGMIYSLCIPYNDQTAHLLGTTKEWKGSAE